MYTISKTQFTLGNRTNRWIFSDFMYGLFWISNSSISVTILYCHQSIINSSFNNIPFHNIYRCNNVAYTTSNEYKELDYGSGGSFFNVLVMWRFPSFYKRKKQPFDSRNSTVLFNWIRLLNWYFYWFLVSVKQLRNVIIYYTLCQVESLIYLHFSNS